MGITLNLGHDEDWAYRQVQLHKAPHLLVAGMTGSGKSVFTNAIITDLITRHSPREVSFLMIDPKRVELAPYRGIPHLLADPVYRPDTALELLWWAAGQMNRRYEYLANEGVRTNLDLPPEKMFTPLIVVVDELANIILAEKKVEKPLVDIASMGRAASVHLILATQRPSADVLTGLLRANVPMRVCMSVQTAMDSRIMLDESGAEGIREPGQMLVRLPREHDLVRMKGDFVTDQQIDAAVQQAMTWRAA